MNGSYWRLTVLIGLLNGWLLLGGAALAQTQGEDLAPPPKESAASFWKRRARYYTRNPLVLKAREEALYERQALWKKRYELLAEAYGQSRHDNDSTQTGLRVRVRQLEDSLHDSRREADSLRFRLAFLMDSTQLAALSPRGGAAEPLYVVQIGAIARKLRRNRIPSSLYTFSIDSTSEMNKYLVGRCRTVEEAKALEAELRGLGLRDAFVAAYQGGERVSLRKAQKNAPVPKPTPVAPNQPKPAEPPKPASPIDSAAAPVSDSLRESVSPQPSDKPVGWQAENGSLKYGFRVQVYSGTEEGAQRVRMQVEEMKLSQPSYVVFDKPHYKVRVGNFNAYDEADKLLGRLKKNFGDAYILNDVLE